MMIPVRAIACAAAALCLSTLGLSTLSACAAPTAGSSTSLTETRWRFETIDGVAPAEPTASLEFHRDRLSASVGCNGMGGPWRIEQGRLIAGPLMSTQMWCEGRMDQERAVGALLAAAPEVTFNADRLKLSAGGHSAELVRLAPPQD